MSSQARVLEGKRSTEQTGGSGPEDWLLTAGATEGSTTLHGLSLQHITSRGRFEEAMSYCP